jgi:hypothetical protein
LSGESFLHVMLKVFDFELVGVVLLFEEEEVLEEVFDLL